MKKLIVRIVLVLVILLVLVAAGSFFFLGTIVKSGVEKVGPVVTKTSVKLDSASISLLGGSGSLKGFVIGNPEGYKTPEAIKVGNISLSLEPGSVLKEKKHIRSIKIEGAEITYETDLKGSNLGKLLQNVGGSAEQDKKAPTKDEQTTKTKLQVDEVVVTGAKVTISASVMGLKGTSYAGSQALPEIRIKDLGQGPDGITPAELGRKILSAVLDEAVKVATTSGKAIGTGAIDEVKKGAGGLLDSFKKK